MRGEEREGEVIGEGGAEGRGEGGMRGEEREGEERGGGKGERQGSMSEMAGRRRKNGPLDI